MLGAVFVGAKLFFLRHFVLDGAKGVGVCLKVVGNGPDDLKRGTGNVVFHALDVTVDCAFINSEEFKESRQGFVPIDDSTGDAQSLFGEGGASVFDMGDQALGIETLQHVGDTGLRDLAVVWKYQSAVRIPFPRSGGGFVRGNHREPWNRWFGVSRWKG